MSDFNKPRPDYPIYPSTGYFQKRAKAFKRPKGRRGRKPKGKRVGRFVPYQDPNFLIIKQQGEARRARDLAVEQAKEEAKLKKAQREQFKIQEKERKEREETRVKERKADKEERDKIRKEDKAKEEERELSAEVDKRQLTQQLQLESDRREDRLLKDREVITGHLTKLYEQSERRAGENIEIFNRAFKALEDRRPINFKDIKAQEQTDLTADQRRDKRGKKSDAGEIVEEVFSRGDRKQTERELLASEGRSLRGDREKPKKLLESATEEELAAAGAIEGQTPKSQRGGTGSEETGRRGKNAGKKVVSKQKFEETRKGLKQVLAEKGGADVDEGLE